MPRRRYLSHTLPALLLAFCCGCGSHAEPPRSWSSAPLPDSSGSPSPTAGAPAASPESSLPAAPDPNPPNGELPPPILGLTGVAGSAGTSPESSAPSAGCAANESGYCWRSVSMGGGGFISSLALSRLDPGLVFARTDVGGAYRWQAETRVWTPLLDWVSESQTGFFGVESLALDPSDANRVYLLVGIRYFNGGKTAILSSSDRGASFSVHEVTGQFTAHGNGAGRQNGERLAVDPSDGRILFAGTRQNGLFQSNDRGATWSRNGALDVTSTPDDAGIAFVAFDPGTGTPGAATRRAYVGVSRLGSNNLFVTENAGASWQPVPGQPTTFAPQRAAIAGNTLFISYGNGAGPNPSAGDAMDRGAIWKLDTATGAWTEVTPLRGAQNRAFSGISIDAANANRLLATTINTYQRQPWGYGDRIFLSSNGGASWTDLFQAGSITMDTNGFPWIEGQAIHWAGTIEFDPFDSEHAFVTSGNGLFETKNVGAAEQSWSFAVKGLEETVPLDAVSVPGVPLISAIGDYDGFVHHDLGVSPVAGRHLPAMGTTNAIAAAGGRPQRLARVGSALYLSDDGGGSWSLTPRPTNDTGGRLALSADGSVLLWSAGNAVHRTADAGQSWSVPSGLAGALAPVADSVNASKFYAYDPSSGALNASNDAGVTFTLASSLPSGGSPRIRSAPGVEGDVWVALGNAGLRRSRDSGRSFTVVAGVDSCTAVGFGAPAPGQSFAAVYIWGAAGGPRGVYRSDDSGKTWLRINDDAHQFGGLGNGQFVLGDLNVYGRVFLSTAGRGVIVGELAP
jgi:xyloglucan-specific exo-beta-1,4-glucanase